METLQGSFANTVNYKNVRIKLELKLGLISFAQYRLILGGQLMWTLRLNKKNSLTHLFANIIMKGTYFKVEKWVDTPKKKKKI